MVSLKDGQPTAKAFKKNLDAIFEFFKTKDTLLIVFVDGENMISLPTVVQDGLIEALKNLAINFFEEKIGIPRAQKNDQSNTPQKTHFSGFTQFGNYGGHFTTGYDGQDSRHQMLDRDEAYDNRPREDGGSRCVIL